MGEARAAVFAELQESLSPELARKLETAIDRRLVNDCGSESRWTCECRLGAGLSERTLTGAAWGQSPVCISPVAWTRSIFKPEMPWA